jgi:hypothetical protein
MLKYLREVKMPLSSCQPTKFLHIWYNHFPYILHVSQHFNLTTILICLLLPSVNILTLFVLDDDINITNYVSNNNICLG